MPQSKHAPALQEQRRPAQHHTPRLEPLILFIQPRARDVCSSERPNAANGCRNVPLDGVLGACPQVPVQGRPGNVSDIAHLDGHEEFVVGGEVAALLAAPERIHAVELDGSVYVKGQPSLRQPASTELFVVCNGIPFLDTIIAIVALGIYLPLHQVPV